MEGRVVKQRLEIVQVLELASTELVVVDLRMVAREFGSVEEKLGVEGDVEEQAADLVLLPVVGGLRLEEVCLEVAVVVLADAEFESEVVELAGCVFGAVELVGFVFEVVELTGSVLEEVELTDSVLEVVELADSVPVVVSLAGFGLEVVELGEFVHEEVDAEYFEMNSQLVE